jgi:asparagine synthase (glutamine-hydrolysing)
MCGIAGIFGKQDPHTVLQMLGCIYHRGPDDQHAVDGENFAFGARRLSIVGVADGRQPLCNEDGTIWAAQNGELYNYPIVKEQLLSRGHKLRTKCDTEILPHLYEDFGSELPEHIDGMFAISIWDSTKKLGILARDRMGKKPLYYHRNGDAIYFASEIKCLLRIPGFERRINREALHHFLSFKHVPCPLTIFEGINVLPPGHKLIYRPGHEPKIEKYWELNFHSDPALEKCSEDEISEHLLTLLRAGVKRRLMSDVPIGFFLSGGIDSSLSTALAAEMADSAIKTFTLTYADNSTTDGKELDRKWARYTAEKFGTEHYEESVKFSEFPENLRRVIGCFDEPFAGTTSTYFLAGLISKHVKVALSGDGADELFGSYLSHRLAFPLANYKRYLSTQDASLIAPFANQPDYLKELYEENDWQWRSKLFVLSEKEKATLYSKDVAADMAHFDSNSRLRQDFSALTAEDPLNRVLEAEFKTIFADQVLAFVDRLSMAHSLEIRSAYLDTELVSFVARLPGRLKIKNGETKYILKKAALKYFPEEMIFRKKEGFVMPVTDWLLKDLESYVRETLSDANLRKHGLFDSTQVTKLIDVIYAGDNHYTKVNKVLELIVFQEWYNQYMCQTAVNHESCAATATTSRQQIAPLG